MTSARSTRTDFGRITCPVIGMLIRNGDLVPDARGLITREGTRTAMVNRGISPQVARDTTNGNFHSPSCPTCPTHIDPFNMNTIQNGEVRPSPVNQPHEHFRSTGIRDTNGSPDAFRFHLAERQCMGPNGRWTIDNVDCFVEFFDRDPGCGHGAPRQLASNDVESNKRPRFCGRCDSFRTNANCESLLRGSIRTMFNEFKHPHTNSLTQSEFRGMWIDLIYPRHF